MGRLWWGIELAIRPRFCPTPPMPQPPWAAVYGINLCGFFDGQFWTGHSLILMVTRASLTAAAVIGCLGVDESSAARLATAGGEPKILTISPARVAI